jgi:hypothetical protein
MVMQRGWIVGALSCVLAATAAAGPETVSQPVLVTSPSPFGNCGLVGTDTLFVNSTVEPSAAVNPTNPLNIVVGYQQDRWSGGGARGLLAGVSFDGGLSWLRVVVPGISTCTGGPYERATDPWVSFAPNGDAYFFGMGFDFTTPPGRPGGNGKSAMLVSKSTDGGFTWGPPITLIEDLNSRFLNDKNTITADPGDARFAYAVWDRLQTPVGATINPDRVIGIGFKGPTMFSRTADGGATWETARKIYDPGATSQTIGNQVVVLPNGTLLNFFNEILGFKNSDGGARFDFNLALIRSTDQGATWTHGPAIRAAKMMSMATVRPSGVIDPDPATGAETRVRSGDILPAVAVDRGATSPGRGNVYAVWQDARFSGLRIDEIAFARSTDGGLTWSTPIKINRTPTSLPDGSRQAFTPTVSVAADGTIAVSYYDFRNHFAGSPFLETDHWIVHCHPSSASCTSSADWLFESHVAGPFDMRKAPNARGYFLGDYMAMPAAGTRFKPVFVQSGPGSGRSDVFNATAAE